MAAATLVLQYPDWQAGKLRLLAATKDPRLLKAFKKIVLEEARLKFLGSDHDVLRAEYGQELRRLEQLPDPEEEVSGA